MGQILKQRCYLSSSFFLLLLFSGFFGTHSEAKEESPVVSVYSSRKEHLIKPVFEKFTKETGIKVEYMTDKAQPLIAKIEAEGSRTKADLLLTVDAGNLWQATKTGLLKPVKSPGLEQNIPEHLRDPSGAWYGLSVRARTIAYHSGKLKESDLSDYEDLSTPKWKGRLCLRTSKKVYNQSLVAMLIFQHGEKKARDIVKGWVENLATKVFSSDTKVLEAIAAGQCDLGIVNTYYFGRLKQKMEKFPLRLFWPNQHSGGVHINVSGAGIVKHAPHPKNAQKLLEWLSSPSAQVLFAELNLEYPANKSVAMADEVKSWGSFKESKMNLQKAGELQASAVKIMDQAGYR